MVPISFGNRMLLRNISPGSQLPLRLPVSRQLPAHDHAQQYDIAGNGGSAGSQAASQAMAVLVRGDFLVGSPGSVGRAGGGSLDDRKCAVLVAIPAVIGDVGWVGAVVVRHGSK